MFNCWLLGGTSYWCILLASEIRNILHAGLGYSNCMPCIIIYFCSYCCRFSYFIKVYYLLPQVTSTFVLMEPPTPRTERVCWKPSMLRTLPTFVLLLSTSAGGLGLNLQAADTSLSLVQTGTLTRWVICMFNCTPESPWRRITHGLCIVHICGNDLWQHFGIKFFDHIVLPPK